VVLIAADPIQDEYRLSVFRNDQVARLDLGDIDIRRDDFELQSGQSLDELTLVHLVRVTFFVVSCDEHDLDRAVALHLGLDVFGRESGFAEVGVEVADQVRCFVHLDQDIYGLADEHIFVHDLGERVGLGITTEYASQLVLVRENQEFALIMFREDEEGVAMAELRDQVRDVALEELAVTQVVQEVLRLVQDFGQARACDRGHSVDQHLVEVGVRSDGAFPCSHRIPRDGFLSVAEQQIFISIFIGFVNW